MNKTWTVFFAVAMILVSSGIDFGQAPIRFRLRENFITGLSLPVHLTNAKDGTKRIFIVQQRGIIKVVQPGSNLPTDFLNISSVVSASGSERGLLGLAFHPQYASNRRFFVYYTRQSDGAIEIAEYEASVGNPNQANPAPIRIIITIPHSVNANHNGGTIAFGSDGYLYAGTGDGGSGDDPPNNAQNINVLLGKFLRLDINTPVNQTPAYNIPPTNPYAGATAGADEIYAIGMRNPYRFSFDRGGTNQLWVGDVGQNVIEEVDIITNGGNYGWRVYEGTRCTGNDPTRCPGGTNPLTQTPPVFEYNRVGTPRCAVTGGYVYRGVQNALPTGSYIYADHCSGEILLWYNGQQLVLRDTERFISSFGEDELGELYVVGLGGTVDKVLGNKTAADFDGDLRTNVSIFRPGNGEWYVLSNIDFSYTSAQFGLPGDIQTAADYDGDNHTDIGVFRPSQGVWFYMRSTDNTFAGAQWGSSGDKPVPGDYNGDGKADFAVFRPSEGVWYVLFSGNLSFTFYPWGLGSDIPVPGDYDGDGLSDYAVWRPSESIWYWVKSSNGGFDGAQFGISTDLPAPGDFDGDGRTDPSVFRASQGVWFNLLSSNGGSAATVWGSNGDLPVIGDYDGDGISDVAVFRPSDRTWYIRLSSNGTFQFTNWGLSDDVPIPKLTTY